MMFAETFNLKQINLPRAILDVSSAGEMVGEVLSQGREVRDAVTVHPLEAHRTDPHCLAVHLAGLEDVHGLTRVSGVADLKEKARHHMCARQEGQDRTRTRACKGTEP